MPASEDPSDHAAVEELLGVYDADGGVRGELAYVVGKLRGTAHCSLCDVTHTPWRPKREWRELVARSEVPVRTAHRNELDEPERAGLAGQRLPVLLARRRGEWTVLLDAAALDALDGSVAAFDAALQRSLGR